MAFKGFIFSDTHWSSSAEIPDFVFDLISKCDFCIHAGDWVDVSAVEIFSSFSSLFAVCGNCDYSDVRRTLPCSRSVDIGGVKIGLTHGRRKSSDVKRELLAEFSGVDLIVFGHSHVPFYEKERSAVFFNPGSLSFPRGGFSPSFGVMEIDDDSKFTVRHIFI